MCIRGVVDVIHTYITHGESPRMGMLTTYTFTRVNWGTKQQQIVFWFTIFRHTAHRRVINLPPLSVVRGGRVPGHPP